MKIEMNQFFRKVCALIVTVAMTVGIVQGSMHAHAAETTAGKNMIPNLLTGVTLQKKENGQYVNATEFKANDDFRMIMHFKVPANTFKEGDTLEMYYDLPSSLTVQKTENGNVSDDSGKLLGTFVIDTNGRVTVTFNKNFDLATAYTGKLNFTGSVSSSAAKDHDETVDFGDSKSTIIIKKNETHDTPDDHKDETDCTVKKTAVLSDDHKTITYKVVVSTKKGTGDKVKIEDEIKDLKNITARYDHDSFQLVKKMRIVIHKLCQM